MSQDQLKYCIISISKTGYSSVGLECALWEREAAGSSPATPTKKFT